MTNVVNLRLVRKRKEREDKEAAAAQNRALHGMPKAERQREQALTKKAEAFIEAHRLERNDRDKP
ncbi:MAG: DUF4169 family protein [Mesorhizobium sp.]|nr:DUF4169 family protein [Mesorhizobium sp.]MBL8575887.1 DUF4169 family protein [Mesorhizobium sp.]